MSVDISAVAYYRVVDAEKSVVVIENVEAEIDQIAQTTLRKVVGKHSPDETLAQTDRAPTAQPAEPCRDRGRQEHDRRVPVAHHDDDRRALGIHLRRAGGIKRPINRPNGPC